MIVIAMGCSSKKCPICRNREIASWESCCGDCWDKLTSEQKANMRIYNDAREVCRECGTDPVEGLHF